MNRFGKTVIAVLALTVAAATAADAPLVPYRDPKGNFTMQVPKGWIVASGGFDLLHWIHAFDPKRPELGVFTLLKTECLLMNRKSKSFYWDKRGFGLYAMFAEMIVAEKVEDFYTQFMPFCGFAMKWEKSYAGFVFPRISGFELLEKRPARTAMSRVALDDALLHATFTDPVTKRRGEGLFTGTLCRGIEMMPGIGCNMMYNVSGVAAPEGELGEWAATLAKVLGSVWYSEAFETTARNDQLIRAAGNAKLAQTMRETSEIVTRGWEQRQKGFDARVGKRADATMGYERVVEKDSGRVYRAYNGFLDSPDAQKRFRAAPDEAYSRPVSGTIER